MVPDTLQPELVFLIDCQGTRQHSEGSSSISLHRLKHRGPTQYQRATKQARRGNENLVISFSMSEPTDAPSSTEDLVLVADEEPHHPLPRGHSVSRFPLVSSEGGSPYQDSIDALQLGDHLALTDQIACERDDHSASLSHELIEHLVCCLSDAEASANEEMSARQAEESDLYLSPDDITSDLNLRNDDIAPTLNHCLDYWCASLRPVRRRRSGAATKERRRPSHTPSARDTGARGSARSIGPRPAHHSQQIEDAITYYKALLASSNPHGNKRKAEASGYTSDTATHGGMHFSSYAALDARRATQMAKLIGERRKKQNSDLLGMVMRAFGDYA